MKTILLLGPGQYVERDESDALASRRALARAFGPTVRVIIMEDEPAREHEPDADKFLRLLSHVDEVVVWLPIDGRLPTVFAELVTIRMLPSAHRKRVAVFLEDGVLDVGGPEFLSLIPEGKIAYLRDLPRVVRLKTWVYTDRIGLLRLASRYGKGLLDSPSDVG